MMGRGAGTSHELEAAKYVRDQFASIGLQPGAEGYLQDFSIGDRGQSPDAGAWSQNVLAVLPGRGSLASQWLVVGAHYDHLGWRQVTADSILVFNGADDNASGTAVLLEVARYLRHHFAEGAGQVGERRSVMFHAYGAEEIGLVGSRYFCQGPSVPLDSVAAMVNLDMVGRLSQNGLTVIGSSTAAFWPELLADANTEQLAYRFDDKYMGGSDQWCYYDAGRPVLFFFTGIHSEYHTPFDDPWLVDTEGMADVAALATRVLLDLASRGDLE
jgi:Zn-dependent M28 family amino/carboxypeptidase